jgi:alpha-ribazole phosphatase
MRLWLARHARPLVEEGLCYGALDVAADQNETAAAAQQLAQALPQGVDVLSSPLRRCTELAQALAILRPDLAPRPEPRLAEMDFGSWEGRPWNSLARGEIDAWTNDFAGYRAGGTGESVSQFAARVDGLLQELRASGRDQAWIAHGGVFKVVLRRLDGLALAAASDWPAEALAWGRWHMFSIEA